MRNIKLVIEYDGTQYHGWQTQKKGVKQERSEIGSQKSGEGKEDLDSRWNSSRLRRDGNDKNKVLTIQGVLENAVQSITNENIKLTGAGRTDAGVHALGQVANFHTSSALEADVFPFAINAHLPGDIAVRSAEEVPLDFNARRSAKAREYLYMIHNHTFRSAVKRLYSYHVPQKLDLGAMGRAADYFKGEHDFSGFTCTNSQDKIQNPSHPPLLKGTEGGIRFAKGSGGVRNIMNLDIEKKDRFIYITVKANSFLMHMVRYMVAALVEVGRKNMQPEDIRLYLGPRPQKWTRSRAPAHGLFLMAVEY